MTWGKRAFDLALALALGVVLLPIIVCLAAVLKLREGGDVLYLSERMKTPTQGFQLVKFRTMAPQAGDTGVSGGDKAARITRTGAVLRRFRLDELPQLWNILKGDMSFVGPRPPLRQYVDRFPDLYAQVLESRPGVTGLATITYHAHEAYLLARCATPEETDALYARACVPRKARLDLLYQRHASRCYDLKLMALTALKLFGRYR